MLEIVDNGYGNQISGNHSGLNGKITIASSNVHLQLPPAPGAVNAEIFGDSATVDLSGLRRFGSVRVTSKNGGSISIGSMSTIEGAFFLADGADISLGSDCMISFGVSFRTNDAHGIYDLKTGDRINPPASIRLGDHVWVGQGCTVSKGSYIGNSSIIGAFSFLSNSTYDKNSIYAGTPARKVREGVVWDRRQSANIFEEEADIDPYFKEHMKSLISSS